MCWPQPLNSLSGAVALTQGVVASVCPHSLLIDLSLVHEESV